MTMFKNVTLSTFAVGALAIPNPFCPGPGNGIFDGNGNAPKNFSDGQVMDCWDQGFQGWICKAFTGYDKNEDVDVDDKHATCTMYKNTCQDLLGTTLTDLDDDKIDFPGRVGSKISALACILKQEQFWAPKDDEGFSFKMWVDKDGNSQNNPVSYNASVGCNQFPEHHATHCMNQKNASWKQNSAVSYFTNETEKNEIVGLRALPGDAADAVVGATWYVNTATDDTEVEGFYYSSPTNFAIKTDGRFTELPTFIVDADYMLRQECTANDNSLRVVVKPDGGKACECTEEGLVIFTNNSCVTPEVKAFFCQFFRNFGYNVTC